MSIRSRIILILMPAILFILCLLVYTSFETSKNTVIKLINKEAIEIANSRVKQFNSFFISSEKVAKDIAISVANMETINQSSVKDLLTETLKEHTEIFGSTISLDPKNHNMGQFAPYYHRFGNGLKYVDLATPSYNYTSWDWYKIPFASKKGSWTRPYMDDGGGNILMTTYSAPIFKKGKVIGIATVDISLADLVNQVKSLTVGGKGFAFIITNEGKFIAYPEQPVISDKSLWELVQNGSNSRVKQLAQMVKQNKIQELNLIDQFYAIMSNIHSTNWTLVIMYPRDEILMPLTQLRNNYLILSGIVLVLLLCAVFILSSTLTKPIIRLVEQTQLYSQGRWDQKLDENIGTKELQQLAKSFNSMGQAIIEQIENVKSTTAQKERYHQELVIAAEIQQSILPQVFPPFPEMTDKIDIYGTTKPAREVGGDYYDFFKLSDNKIGIVIADVSDKGAPSSFFMSMTRMLIREIAEHGNAPIEVLRRTNHVLAEDNIHSMFVTLIYGEYNLDTGLLKMANAGHLKPIHISKDGNVKNIKLKTNLPLGILEDTHYKSDEFIVPPGDMLLLYTDGVTEAMDPEEQQFELKRLKKILSNTQLIDCKPTVDFIIKNVAEFARGTEQSDDITLLCIKRKEFSDTLILEKKIIQEEIISLKLPASTKILSKLAVITHSITAEIGFAQQDIDKITLAIDEIVTNIIMHSYEEDTENTLQINYIPRVDGICIKIIDYGIPFDFESKLKTYDSEEASADQPVGGIGLYLALKSADDIQYKPDTIDGNQTIILKYLNK